MLSQAAARAIADRPRRPRGRRTRSGCARRHTDHRDGITDGDPPGHPSLAPNVRITSPQPSHLIAAELASPATIEFGASDPDGPGPGVKSYRYRLFRDDDPDYLIGLVEPDSLMRKFAPQFVDWTELKGSATQLTLTGLVHGHCTTS